MRPHWQCGFRKPDPDSPQPCWKKGASHPPRPNDIGSLGHHTWLHDQGCAQARGTKRIPDSHGSGGGFCRAETIKYTMLCYPTTSAVMLIRQFHRTHNSAQIFIVHTTTLHL
jgi:hypothetical protein